MRIIQVLPTLSYGDAVSNDTMAIYKLLLKSGFKTKIYAENLDSRIKCKDLLPISRLNCLYKDDLILYHLSTGTKLNKWIQTVNCRKAVIYHNITPPHFFNEYSCASARLCYLGIKQVKELKDTFEFGFCDSDFNKQELISYGYTCPLFERSILIPFEDYSKTPDVLTLKKVNNIRKEENRKVALFVGRIAPNKCQEDLIKAVYAYNKLYEEKLHLFLVGNYKGLESYYNKLKEFIRILGLEDDVTITGHATFEAILAYYKSADLFLCMSEHEGFCVPLVEAMTYDLPIVAFDKCAIKGTLGGSGVLLDNKEPSYVAQAINQVLTNKELREEIIEGQRERLNDFSYDTVSKVLISHLKNQL